MPVGKSGSYHMSPYEMRRKGDSPDEQPSKPGETKPVAGKVESGGDGNHHHEIHDHGDGTMSSVHTNPDGSQDQQEHGSYDEAKASMDSAMGQGQGESSVQDEPASDDQDMAGMYADQCS